MLSWIYNIGIKAIIILCCVTDINAQVKTKSFFPLETGNSYVYETRKGKNKSYDTLKIINKYFKNGFTVFEFSNHETYFVKNDSLFTPNYLEAGQETYNLIYYPTTETKNSPFWSGSCISSFIEASHLNKYKTHLSTFENCYRFYFPTQNKVVIIAHGIGIIQIFQNGIYKDLIDYKLQH